MRFLVAGVAVLLASACQRRLAHDGLLIGLTSGRTIFIAWPNDSSRLVTEKPHLLVPRDDGMWWVGVVSRCTIGEGGFGWVEDSVFLYRGDAVFVTRAGEDARVTLDGTTCEEAEKELLGREPARADSSGGEYFSVEQLYCGLDMARVTFVSPSVLSV